MNICQLSLHDTRWKCIIKIKGFLRITFPNVLRQITGTFIYPVSLMQAVLGIVEGKFISRKYNAHAA